VFAKFFCPSKGGHYLLVALALASAACSGSTTAATTTPSTFVMTWSSLAFPSTGLGATATPPFVVTLWNTGTVAVPVTSVTDTNTSEFPWTTTCQMGGSLAANASCTVTAQFVPNALGAQAATLTINANATVQSALALTGTGVAAVSPQLSISPASGSTSTVFTLALSGATPSGQLTLNTVYTPSAGNPAISFAPTTWTADASGNLSVSATSNSPGSYENWFVDIASGLSTKHVFHTAQ
jgi:hypothetical protein